MSRGVDDATAGMYLYGVLREEELPLSGHERGPSWLISAQLDRSKERPGARCGR